MKKYIAYATLIVIGLTFGIGLTYVNAVYVNKSTTPPTNNTPAPILDGNLSGDSPFLKPGKIGVGTGGTVADISQFAKNSFVVGGQTTFGQGFGVWGDFEVRGEIPSTSSLVAFMFGDPTDSNFWQVDNSSNPRDFSVTHGGYTRAPHIVVGSKTADPTTYNFYIEPTNLEFGGMGGDEYCTLTADDLKNKGCPINFHYGKPTSNSLDIYTPTYLSQVIPGTGSNIVARCSMMTQINPGTTSADRGTCYP
jgi:hypothetical protein